MNWPIVQPHGLHEIMSRRLFVFFLRSVLRKFYNTVKLACILKSDKAQFPFIFAGEFRHLPTHRRATKPERNREHYVELGAQ